MSQTIDTLAIEIEANAANSVDGVRKLSRALSSLATSISKVNDAGIGNVVSNLNSMSSAFSNVGTTSGNASSGTKKYTSVLPSLTSHTNKAASSTKSLAYYFGKFYTNMFLVIRGAKAFGQAISGTMDYMESFNFWDVAITSATSKTSEWEELGFESAQAYAETFKKGLADFNQKMTGFTTYVGTGDISISNTPNLGINLENLTTFQAEIVSVTSSLGLCTQVSNDTSKALSMLAADMSSLKNIDLETVMTNFRSGLIGQSRSLYKYGIDITNATLQTYAYKYGVEKAVSEMTQAEKMQLRMLAILDQSRVAWGDLANTIEQPSNQLRVLKNGIKNLAITIGKLLMPMVSAVLPYLNAMVKALQTFFTWIANVLGVELKVENAGTGTTDIFDDIEDSADDATEAVNALKKSMTQLGIDELNINNPNSDSGSDSGTSAGGGGIDLSQEINSALAEYEKAWEEAYANMVDKSTAMADAIVDAFARKDYKSIGTYISTGLTNALNSIVWEDVYSVAGQFGSGFAQFLNGLITPEEFGAIGKTVAGALNTAMYSLNSFGEDFDFYNFGVSLGTGVNKFFETFDFEEAANGLNIWVDNLKSTIAGFLDTLTWRDIINATTTFLGELELDTVTVFLGGLTLKYGKQLLTSEVLKSAISEKLTAIMGTEAFKGTAIGAGMGLTFALTLYAGIVVSQELQTWLENIKEYGLYEGRRKTAEENPANPYRNGTAHVQEDGSMTEFAQEIQNRLSEVGEYFEILFSKESWINALGLSDNKHSDGGLSFDISIETDEKSLDKAKKDVSNWGKTTGSIISLFKEENIEKIAEWAIETSQNFIEWKENIAETIDNWKAEAEEKFNTWKTNVAATVENWKTEIQSKFNTWKTNVAATVENWKTEIQSKFNTWKTNVAATVENWKTEIQSKFNTWKTNVAATVENWKTEIQSKFNTWKANVAATVENWKTEIQSKFNTWKTNIAATVENWKTEIQSKFNTWKTNIATTVENWKTEIQSKFNTWKTNIATTVENWKTEIQSKFDTFITNTKTAISNWFTKISSFFGMDKWNFKGIKEGLSNAFDSAISAVKNLWNNFAKWINRKLTINIDTDTIIGKGISEILGTNTITLGSLPTFANGGITSADIFAANENGVPELIGTIGRKSAIASGTEVTGIADAVYSTGQTEASLLATAVNLLKEIADKDLSVNLGDREIARANVRGQRAMGYTLITEW